MWSILSHPLHPARIDNFPSFWVSHKFSGLFNENSK
jgi:hypothetical protein